MKARARAAVLMAACLLAIQPVLGQATTATLRGRILDKDGAPLPGVPVTVSSRSHGDAKRTVMTDVEGRFRFVLLPPATDYVLSVNYPGFAPTEVGPIDLDPGKTTVQDVTLRSQEEMTQTVEVTAHGSIVDTESTKTATTFNREYIEGLPIVGRNYQDILTLTPGVTDTDGDGNPNVQGARATGLQYRLDGGNITDPASGTFGQNLNLEAIEEIEVITSGASAEYGRADGGFANLVTKSGGNDFEGSFKLFWRARLLEGDGATENNDTFLAFERIEDDIRRTSPYLTLGGALVKDRLWYFGSVQFIDRAEPLSLAGATISYKVRGRNTFAKLTWQANPDNKLFLQYNDDPYTFEGVFLDFGTEKESDALWEQGGRTPQLRWSSIISPVLLMETLLTHYDSGIAVTPVSDDFHITHVTTAVSRNGNRVSMQALYPLKECSPDGSVIRFIPNCDPSRGDPSIYQINLLTGATSGPFPGQSDDARLRNAIKTDLSLSVEDAWGEHQIKSGLEFADEKYADRPISNPFLLTAYRRCRGCGGRTGVAPADAVEGFQVMVVPDPVVLHQRAVSFNSTAYVTDSWKPLPNLTVTAGLRLDREDVDTSGFDYFDPRAEKRKSIRIVDGLCADADRVRRQGGVSNWARVCSPSAGWVPGMPPLTLLIYAMDADTPEWLRPFDRDGDGLFNSGQDGTVWNDPFTAYPDRSPENFAIRNTNLSPRFSAAWDPWADGRTKFYGTWGRYYDRLFLDTVRYEMGPDVLTYVFTPDPTTFTFRPLMPSQSASAVSILQVDRGLSTPFTDVFTFGAERELVPEWSIKVTFTQRLAWNLLQDVDLNHLLCVQHDEVFGIAPRSVCPLYTSRNPKTGKLRVHLSDDLFGRVGQKLPNGAPDLYNVNPNFNQIFRVGNLNRSKYRSLAMELLKRLHRNWQLQASYTWSRVIGNAEEFDSGLGDDPSRVDDERGYLDYDQRHRVVLIAVTHLPKDVELGGTVRWEGGTPYSVIGQIADEDNVGNVGFRTHFPTHQRNDQRNGNLWGIDLQLTKRFTIGKVQASGQVTGENLLNMDDLTLSAYRVSSFGGVQLVRGPQGLRRFGRIWELAFTMNF